MACGALRYTGAAMSDYDVILCETVARHFSNAVITEDVVALGFGDLQMKCCVNQITPMGSSVAASLFFWLSGGKLGDTAVFMSCTGYAETAEQAIVYGGCIWTCSMGPVLRAGFADDIDSTSDMETYEVIVDTQRFRAYQNGFDRAMMFSEDDSMATIKAARERFSSGTTLTPQVLNAGLLPVLHGARPSVVSVFVSEGMQKRIVEVKVDGYDWQGMERVFAGVPNKTENAMVMMRELTVIVPLDPPPCPSRHVVEQTLQGIDAAEQWPGWLHHNGKHDEPLSEVDVQTLEKETGALPADYREFLRTVAASGAGPGYGLLAPTAAVQARVRSGTFDWVHGAQKATPARGMLVLAMAGCGIAWLLVLHGPHAGEVWVDACGADGDVRRVAPSFSAWYRDWLAASVRNEQRWIHWDGAACATPSVFSQMLDKQAASGPPNDSLDLQVGAIAISAINADLFDAPTIVDPCASCAYLARHLGVRHDAFAKSSTVSTPATNTAAGSGGWVQRMKKSAKKWFN